MANKSKAIGTTAETRIVNYLKEHGFEAERRALKGCKDVGDIIIRDGEWKNREYILEVKAGKQTIDPNRKLFEKWMDQTWTEWRNSEADRAILVVAKFGRSVKDYEVYIPFAFDFNNHEHMYLDQFIEWLKNR